MNSETTQDLVLPTRPPTADAPFAPLAIERSAMDLGTVIRAARRGAVWIGAAAAAGLVLGGLATMALPKTYESYAAVRVNSYVVDDLTQSGRNAAGNDNGLELEAVSDEVLTLAGNSLTPPMSARDVRRPIEVSQVGYDSVLELVVTTNDAERSAEVVNAVADSMLALRVDEVQLGLDEASVSLQSEIKRLELSLVDLDTQLDTDRDPALAIQRDTVDQQLSLLTEIEIRSRQDTEVSAAPDILTEIELLEAELAGIDQQLAGETDLGLDISRDSVASQLSLLNELQVRSDLYSALPGEVLRAGLVPTSAAGIGWQANGFGLALVFAGAALLFLTIQERKLISLRDLSNLVGPPIAKLPRAPVLDGAGLDAEEFDALDAPLHRLDLWVRVRRDQRTLFVSAGSAPAASALIQQLAFHRAGNGTTQVVDFEKEVFGVGLDAIVNTGVRLRPVEDLHPDATVDSLLIVSPSLEMSTYALEAALVSDDVVLVVDTSTVTFESVQTALEAFATVGVRITASVVLEGR